MGFERRYLAEPDYGRKLFQPSKVQVKELYEKLFEVYGRFGATEYIEEIIREIVIHAAFRSVPAAEEATESSPGKKDAANSWILVLSADAFCSLSRRELIILQRVLDGFPKGGRPILRLRGRIKPYGLAGKGDLYPKFILRNNVMCDVDFARVSTEDEWFKGYLNGRPYYRAFFLAYANGPDIGEENAYRTPSYESRFERFHTLAGDRWILTDSRSGQAELNHKNPEVLLSVIRRLLALARQGFSWINLGDLSPLLMQYGEARSHLAQHNGVLAILRWVIRMAAPELGLMMESGTQAELQHFVLFEKDGSCVLIEDAALTGVLLKTVSCGKSDVLTSWLTKRVPSLEGLAYPWGMEPEDQIFRGNGSAQMDSDPGANEDHDGMDLEQTFSKGGLGERVGVAVLSIALALSAIPQYAVDDFLPERKKNDSMDSIVKRLLQLRLRVGAFDDARRHRLLSLHDNLFALVWESGQAGGFLLCLTNLVEKQIDVRLVLDGWGLPAGKWLELISGKHFRLSRELNVRLDAFEPLWFLCISKEEQNGVRV